MRPIKPIPPTPERLGEIRVVVSPAEATILIDGQPAAIGCDIPLKAGDYRLVVSKTGLETQSHLVKIRPGQTLRKEITLSPRKLPPAYATRLLSNVKDADDADRLLRQLLERDWSMLKSQGTLCAARTCFVPR